MPGNFHNPIYNLESKPRAFLGALRFLLEAKKAEIMPIKAGCDDHMFFFSFVET